MSSISMNDWNPEYSNVHILAWKQVKNVFYSFLDIFEISVFVKLIYVIGYTECVFEII